MSDDSYDILRRALLQALGPQPGPERRRQVAAELRALAEQQERMAARGTAGAAQESPTPPRTTARTPGMYLRIGHEPDPQTGARRIRLSLGKQAWFDLGSPERIEVQRVGAEIWVVAAKGAAGVTLSMGGSLPSCIIGDGSPAARLAPGRYAVALRAGALVVGQAVG